MRVLLGISAACLMAVVILTFGPALWDLATDPDQPWRLRAVVWVTMVGSVALMLAGVVRVATRRSHEDLPRLR